MDVASAIGIDSFIQTLQRIIAGRGFMRSIRSDHGTNFLGTDNELKRSSKNGSIANQMLSPTNWKWHKIAYRSIRSFSYGCSYEVPTLECQKYSSYFIGSTYNDESLRTLITKSEAIINSKPLTLQTLSDVSSKTPLPPSNLLKMSPPGGAYNL